MKTCVRLRRKRMTLQRRLVPLVFTLVAMLLAALPLQAADSPNPGQAIVSSANALDFPTNQEMFDLLTRNAGVTQPLVHNAKDGASLTYGQAYPDIGMFTNAWGNWGLWMGWEGSFSETYSPESEAYAWVVYFAPEAMYVALQSGKSVYSGVDVNAGFNYYHGMINLPNETRLRKALLKDELKTVAISANLFSASAPGVGVGALGLGQLSYAVQATLTFLREKDANTIKRGIQYGGGVSVSFALVANPLPFSVALGTDPDADDAPELGQFYGFYPILIWDLEQDQTKNPVDLIVSRLESETYPAFSQEMSIPVAVKKKILNVLKTVQTSEGLREFMESANHNSEIDGLIGDAEQWLATGDPDNLDTLPRDLILGDPAEVFQRTKAIGSATNLAFELGYKRGCESNPDCTSQYNDCVKTVYCADGQNCRVVVTADEIAAMVDGAQAADFDGADVAFDRSVENYMVKDGPEEWVTVQNGQAVYEFIQNTDAPLTVGVRVPASAATGNKTLELCRRNLVYFSGLTEQNAQASGGALTALTAVSPDTITNGTNKPDDMLYGLVDLRATADAPGGTVAVTITLPDAAPAGYKWFKYSQTDGWFDFSRDVISGGAGDGAEFNADRTQVTIYITDNGAYDDDPTDGVIRDPSGLGVASGDGGGGATPATTGGSSGSCFISAMP